MKVIRPICWLRKADFETTNPISAVVVNVVMDESEEQIKGNYLLILQILPTKLIKTMSLWGNNLLKMIDAWDNETKDWLGKTIEIKQETDASSGKTYRNITPQKTLKEYPQ